ncbi:hypothetical protein [Caenispirillum bisanense]|uniref:Uncharacterized protein n=1 Tax=Caenispirillum bisanense TaxID=414052 RepID=A0A286GM73_9PROT|nr:hypothetical protein SAMN05421508_10611 [Caenispirillum bisanense]
MTDEMRARLIEMIAQLEELYRDHFKACHETHRETIQRLEGR